MSMGETDGKEGMDVRKQGGGKWTGAAEAAPGRPKAAGSGQGGKKMSLLERYLVVEIAIEFKACIYFFSILFFYSTYRLIGGSREADILHMGEMILLTYGMGYFQRYVLGNFDEGERLGVREALYLFLCVGIFAAVSYLGNWFGRSALGTVFFALFMVVAYLCGFLVYKLKRVLDAKQLNEDLRAFQERGAGRKSGEGNGEEEEEEEEEDEEDEEGGWE